MGGQVSVESVDMAVFHLCDLDEGGTLGSLAPPRSEKPVQAACLSRESNKKNRPLRDGLNTSWGLVFDRIGETGFEPAASCSQVRDSMSRFLGIPVYDSVSAMLLSDELSAAVARYFAFCARFAHTWHSEMPLSS